MHVLKKLAFKLIFPPHLYTLDFLYVWMMKNRLIIHIEGMKEDRKNKKKNSRINQRLIRSLTKWKRLLKAIKM